MKISVVIPTYGREQVLVETLQRVLELDPLPAEVVVVDQTPDHERETEASLVEWSAQGRIRWIRRAMPSIPASMNDGLVAAAGDVVLFLDDDVVPVPDLLRWHAEAFRCHAPAIVVGQVLQPGEESVAPVAGDFRFCNDAPAWIVDAIACNMAVHRATAIAAGGFDENFRGAAYRFEKEFALRAGRGARAVYFEPRASIRHLRAERGGTRAGGSHLTTLTPHHSVGGLLLRVGHPWRRGRNPPPSHRVRENAAPSPAAVVDSRHVDRGDSWIVLGLAIVVKWPEAAQAGHRTWLKSRS